MIYNTKIRIACSIAILGLLAVAGRTSARENITTSVRKTQLKTTASGCTPASASIDLDINNVRARLMTGGDMWWNNGIGNAAYEVPKGSGKHSQFAASCWIGGYDQQGQLKVAAQTYRQDGNDYWPGALDNDGKITQEGCNAWDRFWKVDRSTINKFIQLSKTGGNIAAKEFDPILEWPAVGNNNVKSANGVTTLSLNINNTYAPFVDLNANGLYEPAKGEYPKINGDQFIWWVFNDAGNVKQQTTTAAMGIEVQTSAFAYATQDFLNNATFCNYRVINRGALTIDSTYIAVWDDADLGYYNDDYIGCDTTRGLGILYNGTNNDGGNNGNPTNSYGLNPPQIALDFFKGPLKPLKRPGQADTVIQLRMTNFTYYNNDQSIIGNPNNGVQIYFYMTGAIRTGQRFANDFQGAGTPSKGYGTGPISNFVFWGDPGNNTEWSECACNNNPGDRRFIFSSGPFKLLPGAVNDITFGSLWAKDAGGCGAANFKTIKNIDDQAQALFDMDFKTIEGPEAPRLIVRELDRKLVFYLVNEYGSNNYAESYGRDDGAYKDSLLYHQIVIKAKDINNDSLYRFQGYRVFQLANSQVSISEIFDPNTGEVDNTKAYEVFQCDVRDGVKQIVNYTKDLSVSDTTNIPQIKVVGRDSGIVHSFQLTQDQFATGADKQFINYHNYYFVAIAYAYNNFASFDPKNITISQDIPYLGSSHGAAGSDIEKVVALPNPANGAMGTVLNADFGSGVKITRVQGTGNGGNAVSLDEATEAAILNGGTAGMLTYKAAQGPVSVKVIDPVKVQPYDWVLQIDGTNTTTGNGLATSSRWKLTGLQNGIVKDTIYSENTIGIPNEQILEKYGISVTVKQVSPPGVEINNGNGYITSSIEFADPSKSWMWGVEDKNDSDFANWLRSGRITNYEPSLTPINPCLFNDFAPGITGLDSFGAYANLLSNFTPAKSTWGPYVLVAPYNQAHYTYPGTSASPCGFQLAYGRSQTQDITRFKLLSDVDVVLTADKTKWTRCAVIEMQEDSLLSEARGGKFSLRRHAGWNGEYSGNSPIYSEDPTDNGMSWFPGYAINQNTGERLNIVFGEDSYLTSDNGSDMIWNPSSRVFNQYFTQSIIFGGRHVIYVNGTKYDSCKSFINLLRIRNFVTAYQNMQWLGVPTLNPTSQFTSLAEGLIPTTTRLKFRVTRPYAPAQGVDTTTAFQTTGTTITSGKASYPYYTFSTSDLAPVALSDTSDRDKLLSRIHVVPNPYYGFSGLEQNRLDTKVRIINLPQRVTVHIYSLDGSLVRTLSKDDPNTPYLDWDIRNAVGLPIASGMYMIHVQAAGIGETVLRWFGATRPLDVSTY